jgi:PadR family transcriptional regulator PadR
MPDELLRGTLDLLILKALDAMPSHGMGVSRRIAQITDGAFDVKPGSLFPALHRLEERGWLASEWGESATRRRAKSYRLTAAGRKRLRVETEQWERVSLAIGWALKAT